MYQIHNQDILQWCKEYDGAKFHAALLDPPYELGMMNKHWDKSGISFNPETWAALAEHLHDGAFIICFAGSRGWHRQAVALEDAGLIMHSSIFGWNYSTGFPKASRVRTGEETETGETEEFTDIRSGSMHDGRDTSKVYTRNKKESHGNQKAFEGHRYGLQALKPALEPLLLFQKPYRGKPIYNIISTGAGTLNIDASRIRTTSAEIDTMNENRKANRTKREGAVAQGYGMKPEGLATTEQHSGGRWPANFLLQHHPDCVCEGIKTIKGSNCTPDSVGKGREGDHSNGIYGAKSSKVTISHTDEDNNEVIADWNCHPDCAVLHFNKQSGITKSGKVVEDKAGYEGDGATGFLHGVSNENNQHGDSGYASRFFFNGDYLFERLEDADPVIYAAKASRSERELGLKKYETKERETRGNNQAVRVCIDCGLTDNGNLNDHSNCSGKFEYKQSPALANHHPTVKPISLAKYLATLLLPPEQYAPRRLLVPFSGSGSEIIGGLLAGWEEIIGIEREKEYADIAQARLKYWASIGRQAVMFE